MIALFKCILDAAVLENKTHEALNYRIKGLSPKNGECVSVYNYPTLLGNVTIFGKQAFEINKRNVSAWNICYALVLSAWQSLLGFLRASLRVLL